MLGIVEGTEPCPSKTINSNSSTPTDTTSIEITSSLSLNPDYTQWLRRDQLALSWMLLSLSEELFPFIVSLRTSKQVWDALAASFASQAQA